MLDRIVIALGLHLAAVLFVPLVASAQGVSEAKKIPQDLTWVHEQKDPSAEPLPDSCSFHSVTRHTGRDFRVGYFSIPPYAIADEGASVQGVWPRYLSVLLGRSGIEFTEAIYPAKRLASNIFSGRVDLAIVANNILLVSGAESISFLPEPVSTVILGVVSLKASPVLSLDAMRGKTLGVSRGYGYGGLIHSLNGSDADITFWSTDTTSQLVKLILGQRLEASLLYESALTRTKNELNVGDGVLHFEPIKETDLYIALSNKTENVERLKEVLIHNMSLLDESSALKPCP